jgi:methyl-accepting chemotaxis protein
VNENIGAISKNVDNLLELISLINNVASQTNLLSMNAAIEAAHAGDFGKAFGQIQDSVRDVVSSFSEIAEISEEASGIAAESEKVEDISRKNADNAVTLLEEVEIFKTE